jgi:hypothetical protein
MLEHVSISDRFQFKIGTNCHIIPQAHETFYKMLGKVLFYKVDCPHYFYVSHNNGVYPEPGLSICAPSARFECYAPSETIFTSQNWNLFTL